MAMVAAVMAVAEEEEEAVAMAMVVMATVALQEAVATGLIDMNLCCMIEGTSA